MLIGVDWGGTKIEVIALAEAGTQLARARAATPWSDYDGCLALIASMVAQVEETVGGTGTVGVGLPGSLDPRTRMAKGASSTWLNGRPSRTTSVASWAVTCAPRTTPTASPSPRPPTARAPTIASSSE